MISEIVLKVVSSSGEPYDVHFKLLENKLSVLCNCPAGIHGKLCKHKIGLLNGDSSFLFNKNEHATLDHIQRIVEKSKYEEIISLYNNLKKEIEIAQKKEKKLKEQIEHILKTGLEIL